MEKKKEKHLFRQNLQLSNDPTTLLLWSVFFAACKQGGFLIAFLCFYTLFNQKPGHHKIEEQGLQPWI